MVPESSKASELNDLEIERLFLLRASQSQFKRYFRGFHFTVTFIITLLVHQHKLIVTSNRLAN